VSSKSNSRIGSLGGGGRYDDLTTLFNMKNTSGVGISFGLDRIYLLMEEKNLFPEYLENSFDIIIINFGIKYLKKIFPVIDMFRENNKKVFVYPDEVKLNKQFSYANKHNASFAIIMGEDEFNKDEILVKNLTEGSQLIYPISKLDSILLGLKRD
jgi:histidyl-tRNA synthetase